MNNSWFRSWHGAPTDHKWLVIAQRAHTTPVVVAGVVWALLDYASQNTPRGSVAGFDAETYGAFAGVEEATVIAILGALQAKGVLGPDGSFTAWEKRQPEREDSSTERVRAHRQRDVTQTKRDVTQTKRNVTQTKRNVTHGNAPEEEEDKDPDPEEDKDEEGFSSLSSSSPAAALTTTGQATTTAVAPAYNTEAYAEIAALYEQNIGLVTSIISDAMKDALSKHPTTWLRLGIEQAVKHDKRSWGYVEGCLRNWQAEGIDGGGRKNGKVFKGQTVEQQASLRAAVRRARQGIATAKRLGFEPPAHDLAVLEKAKQAGIEL